jgi:Fe-S cluster biosynthesis and repair protein YggX
VRLELTAGSGALKRSAMARMVQCAKLGREAEGLDRPPLKGELGQKIFDSISKEAWRMWLEHSKMLINEYRLDLTSEQGQKLWMEELEKYFFGPGSQLPPDFQPQKTK